jgi:hypothetical protein
MNTTTTTSTTIISTQYDDGLKHEDRLARFIDVNKKQIPHVLHRMWLDKKVEDAPLPTKYTSNPRFVPSFKRYNPAWGQQIWTTKRVREELFSDPVLKRWEHFYYQRLQHHIERCDFARYMLLWKYGGVYADLDMECFRSLDGLIQNRSILLVHDYAHQKKLTLGAFSKQGQVFNGFMGSAPKQPFWLQLMDYIMSIYNHIHSGLVMNTTGPVAVGNFMLINNIYDELENPELFVPRCLVLPEGVDINNNDPDQQASDLNCAEYDPYVTVRWFEGTYWQVAHSKYYVSFVIKQWHAWILFLMLILFIILGAAHHEHRKHLERCKIKVVQCEKRIKQL